jgi:inosose dehydratase
VRMGAMTEPPTGVPAYPPIFEAIEELGLDVFAIVEHDLYPCDPDLPFGIAQRTHRYIGGCGLRSMEIGRPRTGTSAKETLA